MSIIEQLQFQGDSQVNNESDIIASLARAAYSSDDQTQSPRDNSSATNGSYTGLIDLSRLLSAAEGRRSGGDRSPQPVPGIGSALDNLSRNLRAEGQKAENQLPSDKADVNKTWERARESFDAVEKLLNAGDLAGLHKTLQSLRKDDPAALRALEKLIVVRLGLNISSSPETLTATVPPPAFTADLPSKKYELDIKDGKVTGGTVSLDGRVRQQDAVSAEDAAKAISKSATDGRKGRSEDKQVAEEAMFQAIDLIQANDFTGLNKLVRELHGKGDALGHLTKLLSDEYGVTLGLGKNQLSVTFTPPGRDRISTKVTMQFDKDGKMTGGSEIQFGGFTGGFYEEKPLKPDEAKRQFTKLLTSSGLP